MGTVFRKSWTAPLPPGAEIIVQCGKRIARYRIRSGKLRTAEVFTAADGRVRMPARPSRTSPSSAMPQGTGSNVRPAVPMRPPRGPCWPNWCAGPN